METTIETMIRIMKNKFDITQDLAADTIVEEINIDSLDLINFLFSLDKEIGVEVQLQVLVDDEISTLGDLAAYIDAKR